ncbi:hypothetical protein [Vibrio viridaestus]|uniref:hypothetical protein n=1 Tax=Vibrio viridaestus TaxID=2487322 RepID=UPI001408C42F|nr:hypothetical protein [Vibrio viridaestus]
MKHLPDIYQKAKEKCFPNGFSGKPLHTGKDYRYSAKGQREFKRAFATMRNRMAGV